MQWTADEACPAEATHNSPPPKISFCSNSAFNIRKRQSAVGDEMIDAPPSVADNHDSGRNILMTSVAMPSRSKSLAGPKEIRNQWSRQQDRFSMLLSGQEIRRRLRTAQQEPEAGNENPAREKPGGLLIEPFTEDRLNPNSYNLALHNELLI